MADAKILRPKITTELHLRSRDRIDRGVLPFAVVHLSFPHSPFRILHSTFLIHYLPAIPTPDSATAGPPFRYSLEYFTPANFGYTLVSIFRFFNFSSTLISPNIFVDGARPQYMSAPLAVFSTISLLRLSI